ncbi:C-type lectin domain family 4 member M [Anabarilius grahami]|uniref:C-type lectin domain family 4 member M n=1 Tax=Anabarilius grahami TaxID=495550 RepID=A0A3N0XPG0_ANAGA|nr:C-type lectin domain family 4 member M [Anabarilius grahami]
MRLNAFAFSRLLGSACFSPMKRQCSGLAEIRQPPAAGTLPRAPLSTRQLRRLRFSQRFPSRHRAKSVCVKIRSSRAAAVCLVLLCVLLLTAVIVLCVTFTLERRQFISKNENLQTSLGKLDGWVHYQSSLYFISFKARNWTESRRYCTERGADLIIINNREEQEFVRNSFASFWIGLTDSDVEGRWEWVDGSTLTSGIWRSGEPNNYSGDEDCAMIYSTGWNDYPCKEALRWILGWRGQGVTVEMVEAAVPYVRGRVLRDSIPTFFSHDQNARKVFPEEGKATETTPCPKGGSSVSGPLLSLLLGGLGSLSGWRRLPVGGSGGMGGFRSPGSLSRRGTPSARSR